MSCSTECVQIRLYCTKSFFPDLWRHILRSSHLAPELLDRLKTPVRVIWGEADPWEPVQRAREWMKFESVQELHTVEALGHCPHDESPEQINPILLKMLSTQTNKSAES